MKWTSPKEPKLYDKRVARKFLFTPRTFGRDSRWLEFANIIEIFKCYRYPGEDITYPQWVEIDFEDNRTKDIEKDEGVLFGELSDKR